MMASTGRSGLAILAAIAYGIPPPMDSSRPARLPSWRRAQVRSRAYQLVAVPQSTATMASSASRAEMPRTTASGFTGSALASARAAE